MSPTFLLLNRYIPFVATMPYYSHTIIYVELYRHGVISL
jgi:hypothetical protein